MVQMSNLLKQKPVKVCSDEAISNSEFRMFDRRSWLQSVFSAHPRRSDITKLYSIWSLDLFILTVVDKLDWCTPLDCFTLYLLIGHDEGTNASKVMQQKTEAAQPDSKTKMQI